MKAPSDRHLAAITLVVQLVTLFGVYSMNSGIERQSDLISVLIKQERAMTTTYVDVDGFSHTVETPYQGAGTAAQHRIDLSNAFCEFNPRDPPSWWNAGDCGQ